ncbi:hypothetical protein M8494_03730 [Serratia ureilytica]
MHGLLSWAITTLLTTWLVVSLAKWRGGAGGQRGGQRAFAGGQRPGGGGAEALKASSNSWIKGISLDWGNWKTS